MTPDGYYLIHRLPDGTFDKLIPIDAEPVIEDGQIVGYRLTHNAALVGGPGDGMLMDLSTPILVWDSPWRATEPGEYRKSERTDPYGRAEYDWFPDER